MRKRTLDRERWVGGTSLLLSLLKDDLAIAKAIRSKNYHDLHAAALIAAKGLSPSVAMTDPAQYKAIREATTIFYLKGYRCLNVDRLAALSARSPS